MGRTIDEIIQELTINETFISTILTPILLLCISMSVYEEFELIAILLAYVTGSLISFCEIEIDYKKKGVMNYKTNIKLIGKIVFKTIVPLIIYNFGFIVIKKRLNMYDIDFPAVEIVGIFCIVICFIVVLAIRYSCDNKQRQRFFYINLLLFIIFLIIGICTVYSKKSIITKTRLAVMIMVPFLSIVFYGIYKIRKH